MVVLKKKFKSFKDGFVGGFKEKIVSFSKTNTLKQTVYGRGKKLSKPLKQNIKDPSISEEN